MEDTGIGMEVTATGRTRTDRPMGAAQDAVSEEADTLVGEDRTGTTSEAEVCEGVVSTNQPSPPRRTDIARRRS